MGNLATRPGVRRNHPQPPRRRHGTSPTPPATQAGFSVLKFLEEKKTGGGVFYRDLAGTQKRYE
jgi:hypothetical protein